MTWVLITCVGIQSFYYLYIFSRLAFYKEKSYSKKKSNLTVVICYKNEANVIDSTLPLILKQNFAELILINDVSTDQTLETLKKYKSDRVKVISTDGETPGKKQALHKGILAAENESIILTDADCTPASEHWADIINSYESDFVLGYGPMKKENGTVGLFSRYETYMTALQYLNFALLGIPYMGVGRNMKISKTVVLENRNKIQGSHLASGDDDLTINTLANEHNTSICIHPDSFVYSSPKSSWKSFLNQKTRHISTSPYYKLNHKMLLGGFSGTQILFYLVLVFSITTGTLNIKLGLLLLLLKWGIQQVVNFFTMKKLNEKDLFWKFPFLDIMFFVYLLLMPFYYLFNKKNTTWN